MHSTTTSPPASWRRPARLFERAPFALPAAPPWQSPQAARIALAPLSAMLTLSLRRVLRRHPGLHDRLDAARNTVIRIAPAEYPVAFEIALTGAGGTVTALPKSAPGPVNVRVEAPLECLLTIFQGEDDGDAAFFSSELVIEGEMAPLVALRNAIEAAGLDWRDLLPLPLPPGMDALIRRLA